MNRNHEKLLIKKIRRGKKEAFGQIWDHYVDRIFRFIFFKVSTREEAQDLTADCFERILNYILRTDGEIENLQALIYQIARNLVIDYYRDREKSVSLEERVESQSIETQLITEKIDLNLQMKKIYQVLRQLKAEYSEIIILRYLEDYSFKELAQIMNKSEGAIRVQLHRAMKELRKRLSR